MGLFNFVETFFFVSLGITFVLILLLVYHFKQRVNAIEQKSDTMFEIINNVVKELTLLRNLQLNPLCYNNISCKMPLPNENKNDVVNNRVDVSSDTEDSDEDDDEDIDDDGNSSDSDGSAEDDDDNESVDENETTVVDDDSKNNVKIINVEIQEKFEITELPVEAEAAVDPDVETTAEESIPPLALDDEVLQVEKIDVTSKLIPVSIDQPVSQTDINKEVYRKMSVQELKALVISKGLGSDVSKLKKVDLLKLLEDEA